MKKIISICLIGVALIACNQARQKKISSKETQSTEFADSSAVYVYYFHGKQRCKTCVAVENVARQTIVDAFAENSSVKYVEVKTYESENDALVKKYAVTWNALIIAKGDKQVDITSDAFAKAVSSPEELTEQIKAEVNKLFE